MDSNRNLTGTLAPIALFVYNRPNSTRNILNSLSKNLLIDQSILYIFQDAPADHATEKEKIDTKKTRDIISNITFCKEVKIIISDVKKGLATSIITGVSEIINIYGKIIVLEDDLLLSPFFLSYMNDALFKYKNHQKIGAIAGCNFFACGKKYPSAFLLEYPDCWGWATWKDRWQYYDYNANQLLNKLTDKNLIKKFNLEGCVDFLSLLKNQTSGKVDTWDIQWNAICTLKRWLILYPNPSVSQHTSIESFTHNCGNILPPLAEKRIDLENVEMSVNKKVFRAMKNGYQNLTDYYGNYKWNFISFKIIFRRTPLYNLYKFIKFKS